MNQKAFDFPFRDMTTGAAILVVPGTLEKINHLLDCLEVKTSKGHLADNYWHLFLTFKNIEIIVRVSDSDANDLRVQTPELVQLVFQMFSTLVAAYAQTVLTNEAKKEQANVILP